MTKWTHIILHCSATEDGKTVSWDDIRRYHKDTNKWADIGYHAGIELVDNDYIIMAGRPLNMIGAHCQAGGMNKVALGFCFVGNYDTIPPPTIMLTQAAYYILGWMEVFNIPKSNIKMHRDYESGKTCPGLKFDIDLFRGLLG